MKILCINTHYNGGGAEKIARQLYDGVKSDEIETYFLAGRYHQNQPTSLDVIYNSFFGRVSSGVAGIINHNFLFGTLYARRKIINIIKRENVDIVHFHNIHGNYIGPKDINAIMKYCPNIVMTMHDMWLITGCCPYGMSCSKWKEENECHNCKGNETLKKGTFMASLYLKCKKDNLQNKGIYFVSPSQWLIDCCKHSYLKSENMRLIPNGIDITRYVPHNKEDVRNKYGIPQNKFILLFLANSINSPYKGYGYLNEALKLIKDKDSYCLVIVGSGDKAEKPELFQTVRMGYVSNEDTMSELYSAADVFIIPSMADNAPLTCMEAVASGTPVLAFATGGIPEIVNADVGWITPSGDSKTLAETISQICNNPEELKRRTNNCRQYAINNLSKSLMIRKYKELYTQIIAEK